MTQIFDSLGWALLHSLWQGSLFMLAVIIFRAATKNAQPSLRYNFQILCLFGCFAAFLVTFGIYQSGEASAGFKMLASVGAAPEVSASLLAPSDSLQITSQKLSISAAASAPLLGILWCLGFAFMTVRYATAYFATQKLRHTALTSVPIFWQNRFRTLVLNTGVSEKVRLFVSDNISGPLTIGFLKPVVLVPAGFLMGLPRDQVEAILLHELAHIRRYDYLVNLFQTAIKTVFFFHPAIHYISKKIDIDREQACDDLAVSQSRDPQALARGLAALRLHVSSGGFAMAADGGDTPLMDRLKRLVGATEHKSRPEQLLMPLIATLLIGGIYLSTPSVANAHPEPKKYNHADAKTHNYSFENKRLNGRNVTVKITEDGRRWILVDGAWVDVDKSPEALNRLPMAMPQPPETPMPGKHINGHFDSDAFEAKMDQFEIDMEYYEADLERYFEENAQLTEREQERIMERAEAQMEREVERAERHAERMEERMEAELERAEEQRERLEEQRERAEEQRERAEELRERAAEQREHAKEQAKRAEKMRYKADKQHAKYNGLRETLYGYLIKDGLVSSPSAKVTMRYVDNSWQANGRTIPAGKENKYCKLFANMGIEKSSLSKIEIKPGSTHIVSETRDGSTKHSHKVTVGEHVHADGKIHRPTPPAVPEAPIHKMNYKMSGSDKAFIWPTNSGKITAHYGKVGKLWDQKHQGIDIKGQLGAPVYASADGMVKLVMTEPEWGNRIILNHADNFQTHYGHMNSFIVSRGQYVKAGDIIGTVGSTGKSTGPHLHFEIREDGHTRDPLPLIN